MIFVGCVLLSEITKMQKFMYPFQGTVLTTMPAANVDVSMKLKNGDSTNRNEWKNSNLNSSTVSVQSKKRPATISSNNIESEEPAKKKLISNDSHIISHDLFQQIQLKNHVEPKNEIAHKNVQQQKDVERKDDKPKRVNLQKEMRLLSGSVGEVLKYLKRFPTFNAIYEVYANIFKIDNIRKPGIRTMLLRNFTGPVIQGVYYEIDFKMCDVQVGNAVRCVGKFVNSSRFHIYKISVIIDTNSTSKLVPRLNSIANFVLDKQF